MTSDETGTYQPKHLKPRGPQHLRLTPPAPAGSSHRRTTLRVVQGLAVGALAGAVLAPGMAGAATVTVRRGDTLHRVARENGVSVAELARVNNIADPDHVRAGAKLTLPQTRKSATSVASRPPAAVRPGAVATGKTVTGKTVPGKTVAGKTAAARTAAARTVAAKPVSATGAAKPVPKAVVLHPKLTAEKRTRMSPVFRAAARRQGVPADLLMTMCYRESDWTQQATSSVGARGVCQIMPDTARQLSAARTLKGRNNYEKEADNIEMGAAYLRHLLSSYPDTHTALVAYNQGPVRTNKGEILPEAAAYAKTIEQSRKNFRRL